MKNEVLLLCCLIFLGLQLLLTSADLEKVMSDLEITQARYIELERVYQNVLLEAAECIEACTPESQFEFETRQEEIRKI